MARKKKIKMKIYIVQFSYYDYEYSGSENIKAFLNKEKAEKFKEDLTLRNMLLHDEFKKIEEEKQLKRNRIDTMNLTKEEYVRRLLEIGKIYMEKRDKLIEESNLYDYYISNMKNNSFEIEELELNE